MQSTFLEKVCSLVQVLALKWILFWGPKQEWVVVCRVTVDAGVTTDVAGNLNTAASQVLKYRPPSQAVSAVQKTANVVVATTLAAGVASGLLAGWIFAYGLICISQERMLGTLTSLSVNLMQPMWLSCLSGWTIFPSLNNSV